VFAAALHRQHTVLLLGIQLPHFPIPTLEQEQASPWGEQRKSQEPSLTVSKAAGRIF